MEDKQKSSLRVKTFFLMDTYDRVFSVQSQKYVSLEFILKLSKNAFMLACCKVLILIDV